jgi:flagellar motor switch protein FliN/FliY
MASPTPPAADASVPAQSLDLVMDIPVEISVELGTTELPLREVMKMSAGSVIELNKKADEPISLYVNRKLVARGEVVVVDNNFGIKITSLVSGETAAAAASAPAPAVAPAAAPATPAPAKPA